MTLYGIELTEEEYNQLNNIVQIMNIMHGKPTDQEGYDYGLKTEDV